MRESSRGQTGRHSNLPMNRFRDWYLEKERKREREREKEREREEERRERVSV